MNRLDLEQWSVVVRRKNIESEITTPLEQEAKRSSPHRFFLPLHYEKNYSYPLLVWLHGSGGSEAEIKHVMPHVSLRNYVGLGVRGPVTDRRSERLDRDAFSWNQTDACVEQALDAVLHGIDCVRERFNVGGNERVFLAGNDIGGTMALRLALLAPDHFGGAISLGGAMPAFGRPLANISRARSLPLMIAHCRDSRSYPTEVMCRDLRLLHSAGIGVCLRQYPCEQEVTTKMLSDVDHWVMEQVVGSQPTSSVANDPTHLRLNDKN